MAWFPLVAAFLASQALVFAHDAHFKVAYDTVLQKKCELLKMKHPAAYVGDRCFAATSEKFSVKLSEWDTLHKKCNHLSGYRTYAAHIKSEKQLDVLLEQDVLENSERYFIGARQSPTDEEENIECCKSPRHSERWHYFDDHNKPAGELNANLWLKDQPDNAGSSPPELVVTLEKLNTSHKLGFNDANPEMNQFAVLCEYVDYLTCPDGWTLIGDECYKLFTTPMTYDSASRACQNEGRNVDAPKLAAIHDDKKNQQLALLTRHVLNFPAAGRDHNPVLFGLRFDRDNWSYDGGVDKVDFFRWYHKAGLGEPTPFIGKSNMVALLNTQPNGPGGETRYTYWTVGNGDDKYQFICQGSPIV